MSLIIAGNAVALIGSIVAVIIGRFKSKKKYLKYQTIQIFIFILSNILLNGISGMLTNIIGVFRNILEYYNKLVVWVKIIFTVLYIGLYLYFCEVTLISSLPVIASVIYTWLLSVKSDKLFKYVIILNVSFWCIYDFSILNIVAGVFDIASIVTNMIALFKIHILEKNVNVLDTEDTCIEDKNVVESNSGYDLEVL